MPAPQRSAPGGERTELVSQIHALRARVADGETAARELATIKQVLEEQTL